jgi:hypothetical protein
LDELVVTQTEAQRVGAVEVGLRPVTIAAVGLHLQAAVGGAVDHDDRERLAFGINAEAAQVDQQFAVFQQGGEAVGRDRRVVDCGDGEGERGFVGDRLAIAEREAQRVGAVEVGLGRVDVAAVGAQGEAAVLGLGGDGELQRAVFHITAVGRQVDQY